MRSLRLKLTLAFLLVGLIGSVLVALFVGYRTRSEVDEFLSSRDQDVLVDALGEYYAEHGSWAGVDAMLQRTEPLNYYSRNVALANANGAVVFGNGRYAAGQTADNDAIEESVPVDANDATVGYLLLNQPKTSGSYDQHEQDDRAPPPEQTLVQRLTQATIISAVAAAIVALLVGSLLARTLTKPVQELTDATLAFANGDLDQRVVVRSKDELGQLAQSFNQMSSDLGQAIRSRQQMTADLAHDLRTPLSILRGYTEGLQEGRISGTPTMYTIMHGEVVHLQRLVEDLRVLSLADAGALGLNRRAVDPRALLERAALAHVVQAEAHGLQLQVDAPEELPSVQVDTDRMAQVLNNLLGNALRHTSSGGVTLSAQANGRTVVMQVRDTGSGIPADDLPHIFDRFYRADSARQRTEHGTSGLGLAIAKAIVEAHNGSIGVASLPGEGTTFTITLPAD